MQILILGDDNVGKTTTAVRLQKALSAQGQHFRIYEAGRWAREEFAETEDGRRMTDEASPLFRAALSEYALRRLRRYPDYSLLSYKYWRATSASLNVIVAGVRNPDDFFGMLYIDKETRVIRLKSRQRPAPEPENAPGVFSEGLAVIDRYLAWKARMDSPMWQKLLYVEDLESEASMAQLVKEFVNE